MTLFRSPWPPLFSLKESRGILNVKMGTNIAVRSNTTLRETKERGTAVASCLESTWYPPSPKSAKSSWLPELSLQNHRVVLVQWVAFWCAGLHSPQCWAPLGKWGFCMKSSSPPCGSPQQGACAASPTSCLPGVSMAQPAAPGVGQWQWRSARPVNLGIWTWGSNVWQLTCGLYWLAGFT